MKKLMIAMALMAASLTTSACGPVEDVATVSVVTDKAMYEAEAFYNVPAHAYVTADTNGLLTPAIKAVAKPKLVQLYDLLKKARVLKSNAAAFTVLTSQMKILRDDVMSDIPN